MSENMKRKQFHLTVAEEKILYDAARKHNVSEAEIVRMAIQEFGAKHKNNGNSLLRMAREASQLIQNQAPKDLSEKHDDYIYNDYKSEGDSDEQGSK